MKKATSLIVSLCMLVGVVLSNVLPEPCEQGGNCATTQGQPLGIDNQTSDPSAQAEPTDNTKPAKIADNQQTDNTKPAKIADNQQANKTNYAPRYSYSTSDEPKKRQMVDFPVWARFLCAGIGVGIFLFYLGVGVPCNACGSLDLLRQLKGKIARSSNTKPAEDEEKKPMNPNSPTPQAETVS